MLAEAATAIALIDESSLAVTAIGPPAVDRAGARSACCGSCASTTLVISLKLIAPVAADADRRGVEADRHGERDAEGERVDRAVRCRPSTATAPSASMVESSTTARVVVSMSLIVTEMPSDGATAVFWLNAIASAIAPADALIDDSSVAATLTRSAPLPSTVGQRAAAVDDAGLRDVADLVEAERAGEAEGERRARVRAGDAGGGADAEGEDVGVHLGVDGDVAAGGDGRSRRPRR